MWTVGHGHAEFLDSGMVQRSRQRMWKALRELALFALREVRRMSVSGQISSVEALLEMIE